MSVLHGTVQSVSPLVIKLDVLKNQSVDVRVYINGRFAEHK